MLAQTNCNVAITATKLHHWWHSFVGAGDLQAEANVEMRRLNITSCNQHPESANSGYGFC